VRTPKKAVIPAKAGIQFLTLSKYLKSWMPAFAGMTNYEMAFQESEELYHKLEPMQND